MAVFAIGSVHGAGATTLTLGLGAAWPVAAGRERVVIEANPEGGVLVGRLEELRADRILADAMVAVRRHFDVALVREHMRPVWGGLPVLPASPSAEQTFSALATHAERFSTGLAAATEIDALVDVGRLTVRSPALPFARRAVATLLVSRTRFEDGASLPSRVAELRAAGVDPWLVCVGSRPYDPAELAAAAQVPLVAVLPDDRASASVLGGEGSGERRFRRSLLWRTITELASHLLGWVAPPVLASVSDPIPTDRSALGAQPASVAAPRDGQGAGR